jgi:hypothetical protein
VLIFPEFIIYQGQMQEVWKLTKYSLINQEKHSWIKAISGRYQHVSITQEPLRSHFGAISKFQTQKNHLTVAF